jgi:hypothetical protein
VDVGEAGEAVAEGGDHVGVGVEEGEVEWHGVYLTLIGGLSTGYCKYDA